MEYTDDSDITEATDALLRLKWEENPVVYQVRKVVLKNVYEILVRNVRFREEEEGVDYKLIARKMEHALFYEAASLDDYADMFNLRERMMTLIVKLMCNQ
jgi:hypothetical protein